MEIFTVLIIFAWLHATEAPGEICTSPYIVATPEMCHATFNRKPEDYSWIHEKLK